MIREIRYSGDTITINTTAGTVVSTKGNKYDIITSAENGDIQFLIPDEDKSVLINAETGEVSKAGDEDDIQF